MIVLSRSKNAAPAIARRDYGARRDESPDITRDALTRTSASVTVTPRPAPPTTGRARRIPLGECGRSHGPLARTLPAPLPVVRRPRAVARPDRESARVAPRVLVTQGWLRYFRHRCCVRGPRRSPRRPGAAR